MQLEKRRTLFALGQQVGLGGSVAAVVIWLLETQLGWDFGSARIHVSAIIIALVNLAVRKLV